MQRITSLALLAVAAISSVSAKNVSTIYDCPSLTPRDTATTVSDLRIDDIKAVGFIGDSFAAGFGAGGVVAAELYTDETSGGATTDDTVNPEYRGLSYGIGGDEYAPTVPNYMKHYNKNVTGYSLGKHKSELCGFESCNSTDYQSSLDQLNAAKSGAVAANLDAMIDYLIPQMKSMSNIDFENDWKMVSIQIGGNDMCTSCDSAKANKTTGSAYYNYVNNAVIKLRDNIPKLVVNLIGAYNTTQLIPLSDEYGVGYCSMTGTNVSTIRNRQLCTCTSTPEGQQTVIEHFRTYNEQLKSIYKTHKQNQTDAFAVLYQHSNIDFSTMPIQFTNDDDCLHPSMLGHSWLSRFVWNQLFVAQDEKPSYIAWEDNQLLYCPTDDDRIQI